MTSVAGLQRGDLVFIAGTRADWALHAKVILIEKTPITTTAPPTTARDDGRSHSDRQLHRPDG